jgi:transcriptional regulator with GAF, ATPase, and Fis domain
MLTGQGKAARTRNSSRGPYLPGEVRSTAQEKRSLNGQTDELERAHVVDALERKEGNKARAVQLRSFEFGDTVRRPLAPGRWVANGAREPRYSSGDHAAA